MTLKEMRALLRSNLDDLKGDTYADDTLRLFLNIGLRHVWNELIKRGIYLRKGRLVVSFTSGVQEVAITKTDTMAKIVTVVDAVGVPIDIVAQEFSIRSDKRSVYISRQTTTDGVADGNRRNDFLGWYVVPTSAFDLTLVYCYIINTFDISAAADTQYTDIPAEHHDIIVIWATIIALARLEESSDIWANLYTVQLENLIDSVRMENQEAKGVVDYYAD